MLYTQFLLRMVIGNRYCFVNTCHHCLNFMLSMFQHVDYKSTIKDIMIIENVITAETFLHYLGLQQI